MGQSPQEDATRRTTAPLMIGVGGSASAMNSIERFFSRFSVDSEQAIILVLQHREAFDESWLRALLTRLDGVSLSEPNDGAEIEGGTIYEPAGRPGRCDVARRRFCRSLMFEWREKGGQRVSPSQRKGFGTELLERTMAFELKGKTRMRFNGAGFHCTIVIPLNRRIVHTPVVGA